MRLISGCWANHELQIKARSLSASIRCTSEHKELAGSAANLWLAHLGDSPSLKITNCHEIAPSPWHRSASSHIQFAVHASSTASRAASVCLGLKGVFRKLYPNYFLDFWTSGDPRCILGKLLQPRHVWQS